LVSWEEAYLQAKNDIVKANAITEVLMRENLVAEPSREMIAAIFESVVREMESFQRGR